MPLPAIPSHPVLSTDESRELEAGLFGGDERREWKAMLRAGAGVACAVLADYARDRPRSQTPRVCSCWRGRGKMRVTP